MQPELVHLKVACGCGELTRLGSVIIASGHGCGKERLLQVRILLVQVVKNFLKLPFIILLYSTFIILLYSTIRE